MKRYLLSMAVCAALATPLLADYLVIRINLGSEASSQLAGSNSNQQGIGAGGLASGGMGAGNRGRGLGGKGGGLAGGGGGAGLGGDQGGGPVGGGLGLGSGAAGGGGPVGGGLGLGGGAAGGGGGAAGNRGRGLGGKGGGLAGGGGGGAGGAGLGDQGGGPVGGGLGLGSMGGPPGGGAIGGGLGLGAQGAPGGNAGQSTNQSTGLVANKGDLFIVATEVTVTKPRNTDKVLISHKWGQSVLNPEWFLPDRAVMQIIKVPGLDTRYSKKRSELIESGNKDYMKLADWMLENWNMPSEGRFSMKEKFESYLNELNSQSSRLSPSDKSRLDALLAVRTELAKAVKPATEEQELIKLVLANVGKDYKTLQKGHFVIYYPPRTEKEAEAKLSKMEQAYTGIMYWFALQGRPLPVPEKQMICLLAETPDKFKTLHKMFDEVPMYADGFYSSLDNITILSPTRVDPAYDKFYSMSKSVESSLRTHNLDFKKLLNDRLDKPAVNPGKDEQQKVSDVVTGQIFAIAANAAAEEGDVSTASVEAFRQVAAATGYMPRTVLLPRSIKTGLASFFATPKSSGELNLPSLWSGIGGAHWLYLPLFRKMADARKSGDDAEVTVDEKTPNPRKIKIGKLDVLAVVSDRVFRKAETANTEDKAFMLHKAEAESWALFYYLAKNRFPELRKYFEELRDMPRDMELSATVLEQAFGRAFNLLDNTGENLDKNKVAKFESDWANHMKLEQLTVDNSDLVSN